MYWFLDYKRLYASAIGFNPYNKNNDVSFPRWSITRSRVTSPVLSLEVPSVSTSNPFDGTLKEVNVQARMKIMRVREILSERGFFNRAGPLLIFVTKIINKYRWHNLCAHPEEVVVSWVREFYATMGNGELRATLVRGKIVKFTPV